MTTTSAPILRTVVRPRYKLTAKGGLHFIRGNSTPYFSLTCSGLDHGSEFGGADHETILKEWPELHDLAALHLSDIDGTPMHAPENGFYWIEGGCRMGKSWHPVDKTMEQRRRILVKHFRITEQVIDDEILPLLGDHYSVHAGFLSPGARAAAKARVAEWCYAQKPRWKEEADACIARHGLQVFGDKWEGSL